MTIALPFLSMGFAVRFIIAFAIIAFLYSNNKNDKNLRKGFVLLLVLGAVTVVLGIVLAVGFFVTGGLGFLGNALPNIHFYH